MQALAHLNRLSSLYSDLEAEVEEDAEFEKEEFPIPTDEEETEVSDEEGTTQMEDGIDPDKSEI